MSSSVFRVVFRLLPVLVFGVAALSGAMAAALPAGFSQTVVFQGLERPTAVRFAPDGRVFVLEQPGRIQAYESANDPTPTLVADLTDDVWFHFDHGLLGLAVDPGFPAAPYLYVLYSLRGNPGGRLERLAIDPTTYEVEDRLLLIEAWCNIFESHSPGDLHFGSDGALYVSAGEGANFGDVDWGQFEPRNPDEGPGGPQSCDDPPFEGGALRSQSPERVDGPVIYSGTILRVDPATGAAFPGNPLAGDDAGGDRVIAYGLRNPYRFAPSLEGDALWIADVGWDTWEEINYLPLTLESAVNFGWPCFEGDEPAPGYSVFDLPICVNLYENGGDTGPYYAYNHNGLPASVSAIAFYDCGVLPSAYHGALFFGDASQGRIGYLLPGQDGLPDPNTATTLTSSFTRVVDIQAGPDGYLYYVDYDFGQVRRIGYSGGDAGSCDPQEGEGFPEGEGEGEGLPEGEGGAEGEGEGLPEGEGGVEGEGEGLPEGEGGVEGEGGNLGPVGLYLFDEGAGLDIADRSNFGEPSDLTILDGSRVSWGTPGLTFTGSTAATSGGQGGAKMREALQATNALTLETWLETSDLEQTGPARIAGFSLSTSLRNMTLGQEGTRYEMRLRTTDTSTNGLPALSTPVDTVVTGLQHVVFTRAANGAAVLYVDGTSRATANIGGDLSNWATNYPFLLANESTLDRPWLGNYRRVALYNRALSPEEVATLFAAGPGGDAVEGEGSPEGEGEGIAEGEGQGIGTEAVIIAARDATLYEDATGTTANGAGQYLFAGVTGPAGGDAIRRSLLYFDLDGQIPPGAEILSASLRLEMSRTSGQAGTQPVILYQATTPWTEGPSDAPGQEGIAATAQAGDATWLHSSFDTDFWTNPGGDFVPNPLGITDIAGLGSYTWESVALANLVQDWVEGTQPNHGFVLIGNEAANFTAKRFNSRENSQAATRPALIVRYLEAGQEGEGLVEGEGEGEGDGEEGEGLVEVEGEGEGDGEEGEGLVEGEGAPEGGATGGGHSADQNDNNIISLSELLRVIQFFNTGSLSCEPGSEDGYAPGPGNTDCTPHSSDYNPQNWTISLSELLRLIQFFNSGGYRVCPGEEDGFCPGRFGK